MRRDVRRVPAVLLVAAMLVAAGCTGERDTGEDPPPAGLPTVAAPGAAEVSWRDCPEVAEEALAPLQVPAAVIDQLTSLITFECATLAVPQDWDEPGESATFDIALVRIPAGEPDDRIGSLVVNPGGPGASGVDAAVFLSLPEDAGGLPQEMTRRFDVVGFDPRGVARSSPVECLTDADLDESFGSEPDPVTTDEFDEAVAQSRELADTCEAKYGETLHYYSTRQTAHDLDAVREAVGDERLTYLGFSYGTLLGAVYAQLHPENIRAMVLDGAVDPQEDTIAASEGQARGFERAFDNFADWCDATPQRCPLGPDTRAAVTDAVDEARRDPVPGADGREATAGWVLWAVIATLYSQAQWESLGTAIDQLGDGDPSGVFGIVDRYTGRDADGAYPNLFDALTAVNCVDDDTDVTVDQARDLQDQWREEYPLFGAPLAVSVLDCGLWPAEPDPYPTGPAQGAPPILVVGTTGDPATPYESTPKLAEMLGTGVVLTWEGEGHTVYPGTDDCIDDAVDAYLLDLDAPDDGHTC